MTSDFVAGLSRLGYLNGGQRYIFSLAVKQLKKLRNGVNAVIGAIYTNTKPTGYPWQRTCTAKAKGKQASDQGCHSFCIGA
jgi:hypothetical protein